MKIVYGVLVVAVIAVEVWAIGKWGFWAWQPWAIAAVGFPVGAGIVSVIAAAFGVEVDDGYSYHPDGAVDPYEH